MWHCEVLLSVMSECESVYKYRDFLCPKQTHNTVCVCVCVCMYVCTGQFSLTLPNSSNPTPAGCYLWKQVAGTSSRLHEGCV